MRTTTTCANTTFEPMPGASAIGSRAAIAMISVPIAAASAVTVIRSCTLAPVADMIAGLTTTM